MESTIYKHPRTTWPIKRYLVALLVAYVTLSLFTFSLDGPGVNQARGIIHLGIVGILLLRLLLAIVRKEQSKTWRVYLFCMYAAAPIWLLVEPFVYHLHRYMTGE